MNQSMLASLGVELGLETVVEPAPIEEPAIVIDRDFLDDHYTLMDDLRTQLENCAEAIHVYDGMVATIEAQETPQARFDAFNEQLRENFGLEKSVPALEADSEMTLEVAMEASVSDFLKKFISSIGDMITGIAKGMAKVFKNFADLFRSDVSILNELAGKVAAPDFELAKTGQADLSASVKSALQQHGQAVAPMQALTKITAFINRNAMDAAEKATDDLFHSSPKTDEEIIALFNKETNTILAAFGTGKPAPKDTLLFDMNVPGGLVVGFSMKESKGLRYFTGIDLDKDSRSLVKSAPNPSYLSKSELAQYIKGLQGLLELARKRARYQNEKVTETYDEETGYNQELASLKYLAQDSQEWASKISEEEGISWGVRRTAAYLRVNQLEKIATMNFGYVRYMFDVLHNSVLFAKSHF